MNDIKTIKKILDKYIEKYGDELYLEEINSIKKSEIKEKSKGYENKQAFLVDANTQIKPLVWSEASIIKFIDLFFNRTDVYANSYISSKTNKTQYSFSCTNEWKQACYKMNKQPCLKCPYKSFKPITKDILLTHLEKDKILGSYISNGESQTKLLVFDFDKVEDLELINEIYKICSLNDIHAYLEISQSKKGFHLWIFFDQDMPNKDARRFGFILLSMAMSSIKNMDFNTFDRMFPTQDFISKSNSQEGLGNLIRLPLSKKDIANKACVFLDKNFKIVEDQILFLNNMKKNPVKWITNFIIKNSNKSIEVNLKNPEFIKLPLDIKSDKIINIRINSELEFEYNNLNNGIFTWLINKASFINPEYVKKIRMRISTYNEPYVICLAKKRDDILSIPKGFLNEILDGFKQANIQYKLIDELNNPNSIEINSKIKLFDYQQTGINELLKNSTGILEGKTGSGKTVVGIELITRLKTQTVIFVNTNVLVEQWYKRLLEFTDLKESDIDKNNNKEAKVMIRTLQSMNNESKYNSIKNVGLMIFDECHHLGATSYEDVARKINCKYLYGLTATLKRHDGLEKVVQGIFGNVVVIEGVQSKSKKELKIVYTKLSIPYNHSEEFNELQKLLVENVERNKLIASTILDLYQKEERNILVLSDWLTHIENLKKELLEIDPNANVIMLHGKLSSKETKEQFEKANQDNKKIILATGKFLGEGYDLQNLDTFVNIFPIGFEGKIKQYVGRIREKENKDILAIDFYDKFVSKFNNLFSNRLRTYKTLGYEIIDKPNIQQYIYDLNNFFEWFKIDYDKAKEITAYKSFLNPFFKEVQKIDIENKIKYLNKKSNYPSSWVVFNKRIVWQLHDEYVMRFEDPEFYKEILSYYKSK